MKIIKRIIITIAILIAIPLLIALLVKKDYSVQREIVIDKSKKEVFDYIKYLKNQDNYSKWAAMDTNMQKTYRGTDGKVGFVSAWNSQNSEVGQGEQEIKSITDGQRIDYEIRFIKPFESVSFSSMTTDSISEHKTKVIWNFQGKMNYPMNFMLLVMDFDKMIGDDLTIGLQKLKEITETP